jgi:hypothetical protein
MVGEVPWISDLREGLMFPGYRRGFHFVAHGAISHGDIRLVFILVVDTIFTKFSF